MKKRCISALLLLCIVLSLCSCSFVEWFVNLTTKDIMEKITKEMNRASSMVMDTDLALNVFYAGEEMSIVGDSKRIVIDGEELYVYSRDYASVTYGETLNDSYIIEAFNEGNYFYSIEEGDKVNKFFSPLSASDFRDYYEKTKTEQDVLSGYNALEHKKNEDGTHTVVLTQYGEDALEQMNISLGLTALSLDVWVEDIIVTVLANEEYQLKSVEIEFLFSDDRCSGGQTTYYSGYGTATKEVKKIDPADYQEVTDARVFAMAHQQIPERKSSTRGSFVYTELYEMYTSKDVSTKAMQTNTVSYGVDENGYYFDIQIKTDTQTQELSYSNGVYMVDGVESSLGEDVTVNDALAKELVNQMIDISSFSPEKVKGVNVISNKNGKITYELPINLKNSEISYVVSQLRSNLYGALTNCAIYITVTNYKVTSIVIDVSVAKTIKENGRDVELWGGATVRTEFVSAD